VVGGNAGGGYDLYARALARHLSAHIPGTPTIIVKNTPGAGSLIATRSLYFQAAKDGTVQALVTKLFASTPAQVARAREVVK
jgi:tripartite-type tricarboxylate transporter receptor subunit TctC